MTEYNKTIDLRSNDNGDFTKSVPELAVLGISPVDYDIAKSISLVIDKENAEGGLEAIKQESWTDFNNRIEREVTTKIGLGSLAVDSVVISPVNADNSGVFENTKKRGKAAKAGVITAAVSMAALASWGFEIGPWNETVRADIGFDVFAETLSPAKTGLAVFGATLPIEFIPAMMVGYGLSRENMPGRSAMEWVHKKMGAGNVESEKTKFGFIKDASFALGVGAAAVVAKRAFTEKGLNFKEAVKTSATLAPIIALFSGGVGWATGYGVLHAEGTKFERAAELLKDYGTDAKFWLAIFGGLQVVDFVGKSIKSRKAHNKDDSTA